MSFTESTRAWNFFSPSDRGAVTSRRQTAPRISPPGPRTGARWYPGPAVRSPSSEGHVPSRDAPDSRTAASADARQRRCSSGSARSATPAPGSSRRERPTVRAAARLPVSRRPRRSKTRIGSVPAARTAWRTDSAGTEARMSDGPAGFRSGFAAGARVPVRLAELRPIPASPHQAGLRRILSVPPRNPGGGPLKVSAWRSDDLMGKNAGYP